VHRMRRAGFVTAAIFLPRRMLDGSTFWLPAVGIVGMSLKADNEV